jgi:hypothetical protein
MYNTKINCIYNNFDIFLEYHDISEEDKKNISNTIYREELLNILGIEEYNETELNKAIHELYNKIKQCNELKECMTKLAGQFMSEDGEFGLMLLFAYDYMNLSHICISEYLETGTISKKNIWNLKNIVF